MPVHLIDSPLLGDRVSTPEMRAIFEAQSQYQSWLDVEAALAEAQAEIGMIPAEAAEAIRKAARIELLDLEAVKEHGRVTGHPLLGIVRVLREKAGEAHGTWAHYGATTQDIVDTGLSMDYGKRLLMERNASRVWTCALLDKPSRRRVGVDLDFVGFEIPDVFVVGYGIDYAEQYRYLPYIGKVTS